MGVSAIQHRVITGLYNCVFKCLVSRQNGGMVHNQSLKYLGIFIGFVIYFYIIMYIIFLNQDCSNSFSELQYHPIIRALPDLRTSVNHYFLLIVVSVVLNQIKAINASTGGKNLLKLCKRLFISAFEKSYNRKFSWLRKVIDVVLNCTLLLLLTLNLVLIVICNPSILNPGPKGLSVLYNNIQGFINTRDLGSESPALNMTKVHEIHGYIFTQKPDIIIMNETWLKKSIVDNEIFPNNYKVFRVDRSLKSHPWDPTRPKKFRKNGGGILLAHRTDLCLSSVKFTKIKVKAELISVSFKTASGRNFCISTFYRVGTLGTENFQEFEKHFVSLASAKKLQRHMLIGDFNFTNVSWPSGQTSCDLQEKFINFLTSDLGHTQLIGDPTHKSGNTLDLLFTNIPNVLQNIHVLDHNEFCLSDHFGISFNIDLEVKYKKLPKRKTYNYRKANWVDMNNSLRLVNWDRALGSIDPHVAWPRFKAILSDICDSHIPKRTVKSQFEPPWYDTECDIIRRKKEKWRKRAKLSNNESDLKKFQSFRKKFKQVMNEKMRLNVEDDSDPALISKRFWSHVKSKTKSTRIPETVHYGTRFRSDVTSQSELFNEYFHDQFSEESDYAIDINYTNDQFLDLRFRDDDIYSLLKQINSSKAAGPDGIHGKVLKNCAQTLSYPLSLLFNMSFSTGCIPLDWKTALVVPVFKKGDKASVENYRPISLTSLVMKVFERCIKNALHKACENSLDPRQHGFLNDRSCTTQMIPFTNDLALTINNKSKMDVVYFDFAKAFDSVSHDLILYKLKQFYQIDGLMLKFIRSYLEGRQQQVVVGGAKSSMMAVKSGVPQGSILGPLLFVLFINDMFSCISQGTNIALYADDTKIWREILSCSDNFILQQDIDKLFEWSSMNKMNFHKKKCKVLSVTLQRNILDNLPFNIFHYELNGTIIDYVTSQTDLGVIVNTKLLWGAHCNELVTKARSRLGLLGRTCHFTTNKRQKRSFYLSLVRSMFEHCSVVWSPQRATNINKFVAIQKRAIKWINGEQFVSYSDEVLFEKEKELDILPVKLKFIYNDLLMFYKIVNRLVPITLPSYISLCQPDDVRYTRRNAPIHNLTDTTTFQCNITPSCDTFKNSFFHRTMHYWNSLPVSVRQSERISVFKTSLKHYLWSNGIEWPD